MRAAAAQSRATYAELREELSLARAEVDAAARAPLFTDEEKRQLQEVARSGAMGPQMEEFAQDVRRGDADWESFIRGTDGRRTLLESFVSTAEVEFAEEARQAFDDLRDEPDPPDGVT